MVSLGATVVAQGSMWSMMSEFIESNHVALAFFLSVLTGSIFCFAALWNAHSNSKLKKMTKRQMIDDTIADMKADGAPQKSIDTFVYYARKRK